MVAAGVTSIGGDPMRDDAIMRISSMTKAITSVAALRMVEAGRIGLDESVETWLPELADRRVLKVLTRRWTTRSQPSARSPFATC